jgi:hypothetical protein
VLIVDEIHERGSRNGCPQQYEYTHNPSIFWQPIFGLPPPKPARSRKRFLESIERYLERAGLVEAGSVLGLPSTLLGGVAWG